MHDDSEFPLYIPLYISEFPLYDSVNDDSWLTVEQLMIETADFVETVLSIRPDVIFALDKSARPVAYMLMTIFHLLGHEIPPIRYINIGKGTTTSFNGNEEIIRETYRHFPRDGKILVIDEYSPTGETLQHATKKIKKAFPEAEVIGVTVYRRPPKWQGKPWYIGVRDPEPADYIRMTLYYLNKKHNTDYKDPRELPPQLYQDFVEIYNSLLGNIPCAMPFRQFESYKPYHNPRAAREELRRMCEAIVSKYFSSNS